MSLSSEVAELFASYSQPDEYETQVQLELWAWHARASREREGRRSPVKLRGYRRDYVKRQKRSPEWRARRREYNRQWMARKRAEARAS